MAKLTERDEITSIVDDDIIHVVTGVPANPVSKKFKLKNWLDQIYAAFGSGGGVTEFHENLIVNPKMEFDSRQQGALYNINEGSRDLDGYSRLTSAMSCQRVQGLFSDPLKYGRKLVVVSPEDPPSGPEIPFLVSSVFNDKFTNENISVGFKFIGNVIGVYNVIVTMYDESYDTWSYVTTFNYDVADTEQDIIFNIPANTGFIPITVVLIIGGLYTAAEAPSLNTWLNGSYYYAAGSVNYLATLGNWWAVTDLSFNVGNEIANNPYHTILERLKCKQLMEASYLDDHAILLDDKYDGCAMAVVINNVWEVYVPFEIQKFKEPYEISLRQIGEVGLSPTRLLMRIEDSVPTVASTGNVFIIKKDKSGFWIRCETLTGVVNGDLCGIHWIAYIE